jgi:plastocyanin
MIRTVSLGIRWGWLVVAVALAGCSKTSPTPTPTTTPSVTITITSAGANPKSVQIALGARVLFVNNDTREHEMASDPHPDHTDCPVLNQVGLLQPGQQRETGNFVVVRTCGYHDHEDPTNPLWQGAIITR